jgi:hypothetical protein
MPRRRIIASRMLLAIGAALSILALLAGWVRGQLLDEQRYVETSVAVLADREVRSATAEYLADQLVAVPALEAQLAQRLPSVAKLAAGPAKRRVGDAAQLAAERALSSTAFQRLWREANARSYRQLRTAIEEGDRGALVLDLRPLLSKLAVQLGLEGRTIANLPERAGVIRILSADEVDDVRVAARALQVTAWALAAAALLSLLGGAMLAPSLAAGVRGVGIALLVAAVALWALRWLGRDLLIDEVVADASVARAGKHVWSILTEHLVELAGIVGAIGVLAFAGGSLARRRAPVPPR